MRKLMLLTLTAFILALLVSFTRNDFFARPEKKSNELNYKYQSALRCSPTAWLLLVDSSMPSIPPLTGWGNYTWQVDTKSDSARFYFNQGINLYYGFHIIESQASFQKASFFDPGFAMAYWGQAIAYSPNINDAGFYQENPKAWQAIQAAVAASEKSSPKEKALINAQVKHYSPDSVVKRDELNIAYANEMKKVYQQFNNDADVAVLYADALMNLHPWDLYDHAGKAKMWTPTLVQLLEKILKKYPQHPGAMHYYIHAVEASEDPGRALPYADRLLTAMPDVAHMVHMPSHIYIRTGMYEKGIQSNVDAVKAFSKYVSLYAPSEGNAPLYYFHNVDMQASNAMMAGRYEESMQLFKQAQDAMKSVAPMMEIPGGLGVFIQFLYAQPYLTAVRFGKWDDVLGTIAVDEKYAYANGLWHFARGMAFIGKGDAGKATAELAALQEKMKDPSMKERYGPFNSGEDAAKVAEKILQGEIALLQNNSSQGLKDLQEGVVLEMNLNYDEPTDWRLPVRHYLGAALLKSGRAAAAEKVYLEDLRINPGNIWSLKGLEQSLLAQKKTKEASNVAAQSKSLSAKAGIDIKSSIF